MRFSRFPALLLLAALLPVGGLPLGRAGESADDGHVAPFARAPDAATHPGPDADLFAEGVALQAKGRYVGARRVFWRLLDEYPDSPFAPEARDRSDENAFLGYSPMRAPEPSAHRIDVALMGDGYRIQDQRSFDKAAVGHLEVLLREPALKEYQDYFLFWRFNLASKERGVDDVDRSPPDEELDARKRRRHGPKVREYSTALDCKAAGPQGQVMADPERVWHYLSYLAENDGQAVVFAKRGALGMGGMGIATTGPRGVVVHEFGHAFTGLLDEYAIYDEEPSGNVESVNTTTHPDHPPWQHFLDAKVPGVGVYEGGATYVKGVWRPAQGCAMNTGGNVYCPVCREATILAIYSYVSPIDEVRPPEREIQAAPDDLPELAVVPMQPQTHDLDVAFYLDDHPPETTPTEGEETAEDRFGEDMLSPADREIWEKIKKRREAEGKLTPLPSFLPEGAGGARRHEGTGRWAKPRGEEIRARRRKQEGHRVWTAALPSTLPPGRYRVTAVVRDDTLVRGERFPWVLRDPQGLLEDRWVWTIVVSGP